MKDMADSLFFWGIAKIYKYGKAVAAVNWEGVSKRKKKAIDKEMTALARKIVSRNGKVSPGFKTKGLFYMMHLMQRKGFNPRDAEYWKQKGWTKNKRPWDTKG